MPFKRIILPIIWFVFVTNGNSANGASNDLANCIRNIDFECVQMSLQLTDNVNKRIEFYNQQLLPIEAVNNLVLTERSLQKRNDLYKIANMLIKAGSIVGSDGLYFVVAEGELRFLKLYVENGLDVGSIIDGKKSIEIATENGQQHIVDFLVSKGEKPYSDRKKHTLKLINFVGSLWDVSNSEISTLINNGGDINGFNSNNVTPLMAACRCPGVAEKENNIIHILSLGGDPNKMSAPRFQGLPDLTYPANIVIMFSGKKISSSLRSHNIQSSRKIIRVMLENGFRVSAKDKENKTPLHYAAIYDNIEIALLLLENGAKKSDKDIYGNTPYNLAESVQMIKLLQ